MEEETLEAVRAVLDEHPVVVAYLFGSVADDDTGPLSDIDIGVYLDCDDQFSEEVALNADLPLRDEENGFDLVVLNTASLSMQYEIIKGDLLYCADEDRRVVIETEIMEQYLDMQPFFQEHARTRLEQIAEEGLV